jgi:uncharacterized protein with GYD domain
MPTFIMMTTLSPDALKSPKSLEDLEHLAMEKIKSECPQVKWVHNYAILGRYDYLDIFDAPDIETAMKVSTVIRTFGHAKTEIMAATEWRQYKELIRRMPGAP